MEEKKKVVRKKKKVAKKTKKTSKQAVLPTGKKYEDLPDSVAFPAPRDEIKVPEGTPASLDLKESMELANALNIILRTILSALADGRIDLWDIKSLIPLITEFDEILKGFKGIYLIPDELKDLTEEELRVLASQFFPVLKALKDLIRKL